MSEHTLHWRVNRIKELVEEREWQEFGDAIDAVDSNASTAGGFSASAGLDFDDFKSTVDVGELFQPFLDMPLPDTLDDNIERVFNARKDATQAWNELVTELAANSANWTGDAGDYFNMVYVSKLTGAAVEHISLLEDLESILRTYQELLSETWKAAKQVASEIIKKLKDMDYGTQFEWSSLISLGVAAAGGVVLVLDPPAGAVLLLTASAAITSIGQAGNEVIGGIRISGDNVRDVMNSARRAVNDLREGIDAKGQTIASTLGTVYGLLDANRTLLKPDPPNLATA